MPEGCPLRPEVLDAVSVERPTTSSVSIGPPGELSLEIRLDTR